MFKAILFFSFTLIATSSAVLAQSQKPIRPVNTYSIVAFDSATGEFGAAVQSHWFKVADVIWGEPGVGVVATQSLVDFAYGPLGLEMMRMGKTADQTLAALLVSDPQNSVRQVAMIDAQGNVASHTGDKCIAQAGHRRGGHYSVQANLMEKATVWDAMADAFENAEGDLAERMMTALEAAQTEGGDIRGKQSAAMIVVRGHPTGKPWEDKLVDLRVDDSPEPLVELRRLLEINRAYDHMNAGDEAVAVGDFALAAKEYEMSAKLAPGNPEIIFWHAVTLATVDKVDESLPLFKQVFAMDENWRVLVPRLVEAELLPDDSAMVARIVAQ